MRHWPCLPPALALALSACVAVPLDATVQNTVQIQVPESGSQSSSTPALLPSSSTPQSPSPLPASPSTTTPMPSSAAPSPSASPEAPQALPSASQAPLNVPAPTPTPGPIVGASKTRVTTHSLGVQAQGRSFAFVGPQVGFLSADWGVVRTEDGGQTWRVPGSVPAVNQPSLDGVRLAFSPNGQQGVLASDEGFAFTSDGGENWVLGQDRNSRWGGELVAFDDGTFLVPTQYQTEVTRDQGQSWAKVQDVPEGACRVGHRAVGALKDGQLVAWNPTDGSTERLAQTNTRDLRHDFGVVRALSFADANTGLAVMLDGHVLLSQDGGQSFRQVLQSEALYQARASWADPGHAFIWTRPNNSYHSLLYRLVLKDGEAKVSPLNATSLIPSWAVAIQATGPNSFLVSGSSSVQRVVLGD